MEVQKEVSSERHLKNRFFQIIHHYTIYFQTHMKTSWKHIVNSLIHHKPFHIIWTGQLNFVTRSHFTAWTAPHRVICIFIVFYKPHMLLHVILCNLCSLLWPVVLYLLCLHLIQLIILYYAAKWNKPLIYWQHVGKSWCQWPHARKYWGHPPSKVTLPIEDLEPDLILGSVLVHISNQLTTGLAIFAGSTRVPNTQTHRQLQNVRHWQLSMLSVWCSLKSFILQYGNVSMCGLVA